MPAKSCRSLVDKKENGMQIDFTSPKCENLVIKWSNKQDVAHNALKKTVAKLVWRGKFIHTYKETEEYLFFYQDLYWRAASPQQECDTDHLVLSIFSCT